MVKSRARGDGRIICRKRGNGRAIIKINKQPIVKTPSERRLIGTNETLSAVYRGSGNTAELVNRSMNIFQLRETNTTIY
jgi:hypothetical protein